MSKHDNDGLLDLIRKTVEFDKENSQPLEKEEPKLTFKRDEDGILWSVDAKTGKKVGRIFEHGVDEKKV